ncbi:MAG: TIR domain-containing protein [Planctomycetales bacterium]
MPSARFTYDVFLSHSSRDKAKARQVAEKLHQMGLRVWFDEWSIIPGQLIGKAIDEGLEQSRILVLAMSKASFDSDWVTLETQAALFRDPINRERRFVPVCLDTLEDAQIPRMLRGFKYIDLSQAAEAEYEKLKGLCQQETAERPPAAATAPGATCSEPEEEAPEVRGIRATQRMLRDRLHENFELGECIHSDDFETLFVARDRNMGRDVAIKVPNLPAYEADVVARRFYRKMQAVSLLNHSSIIPVHAGFLIDHLPILVMGYVRGVTLEELIDRTGAQPLRKIRRLLSEVGEALNYSHRYRANHHRLRPSSILYDDDGNAMITPLNFAQEGDSGSLGRDSSEADLRRASYDAPERFFRTPEELDKADQYSLGMIAYEMLIGERIVDPASYESLKQTKLKFSQLSAPEEFGRTNCPARFWDILKRMLAENPGERYESFSDLLSDVRTLANDDDLGLERKKETLLGQALATVHDSLRRCRLQHNFFRDFYQHLLTNRAVQGIFQRQELDAVESQRQHWLLREALDLLVSYADEPASPKLHVLSRVAETHALYRVNERMYDWFLEAVIETVKRHDPLCRQINSQEEEITAAWITALQPGLAFLKTSSARRGRTSRLAK